MQRYTLFLGLFIASLYSQAQVDFYRIKADFSIKEKRADGKFSLQIGTAYYDLNKRKLLYDLSFPSKGRILITSTTLYAIDDTKTEERPLSVNMLEQSIFHLSITNDLKNFGLGEGAYKTVNVERDEDMVITTWRLKSPPTDPLKDRQIVTSLKGRQLFGVVFMDGNDKVISKQFYKDYELSDGLAVPRKIIFITYADGVEQYKIMEFKSVSLNETENEDLYDFPLPDSRRN